MKLLIIRSGALGDTLMLMPLINALSEEHEITILGRKPGIDYLEAYVKQCIDIERGGWHGLFARGADIDIPCPQADHIIAFINDRENIVSGNLNYLFPGSRIDIFPPFPDPDSKTHAAVHMLYYIQSAGISVDPQAAFKAAMDKPAMGPGRVMGKKVVLHPGSGSKKKNYPPDFWFNLLTCIKKNTDPAMKIYFLLGPAEEDILPLMEEKAGGLGAETVIPERKELLSILGDSSFFVGHDSGLTHLAAMLGVNTVALFKVTSVEQWHPLGPFVRVIQNEENENRVLKRVLNEINSML